jgi:UDP-GlcNAc:undecaprenyl-phosphate/decaprenyl-phosphate GlcNAc-1-phosphate transferase
VLGFPFPADAMLVLLLLFVCAWGLSLLLTHHVRRWSVRWGLVDVPDRGRHDHDRPIARAGGIAVFGAVTIVLGLVLIVDRLQVFIPDETVARLLVVAAGAGAIFALGLWDDARHLGAPAKFMVQILIALAVFMAGVRIEALPLLEFADSSPPLYLSLFLTVAWLVGVTNAFNLIDGSDGVAGGAAVLACLVFGTVSLVNGNGPGALVAFVLAGAVLGFLFFNFPPASIFLGDSGSLFIGFMLAAMAVVTTQTASTALAVAVPVVCLGLPILDTLLVMVRRFLRRKPLFRGDRLHIHHILRDLGHSPRRVALVIYAVCVVFALLSLLLVRPAGSQLAVPFVVAGIILWIAVRRLRIPELTEVGRIVERGLAQREVIAHNLRVREAMLRLRSARDPAAMLAALESAFDGSEFRRGEFWLPTEAAGPLIDGRSVRYWEGGCLWRWAAPEPFREEDSMEVRLVFRDASGCRIGRFSLWRPLQGQGLFTDIQLIATELLPEFQRALGRLAEVQQPSYAPVEHQARVAPGHGRLSVLAAGGQ